MSGHTRIAVFALLTIVGSGGFASAESLRCQSINGNLNCSGSSGASCQTINGRTVCISGRGDVVQSFGNGTANAHQEWLNRQLPPDLPTDDDSSGD